MIGGSQTTSNTRKLYTGLAAFKVAALNPSKEVIEQLIGGEYKLNVDYSKKEIRGNMVRIVEIWMMDTAGYVQPSPAKFYVGLHDDTSDRGAIRFVNSVGVFTQAKSKEELEANPNMEWFTKYPFRVAKSGEYELYSFMQKLVRYNNRSEDAKWMDDMSANGLNIEKIYDGDFSGLRAFLDWANENNNRIAMLAAVRKTEKEDRTFYNQIVVDSPRFIYQTSSDEVSQRSHNTLQESVDKGQRPTNALFTVYFQEFKEVDCVNIAPADAVSYGGQPEGGEPQSFGQWTNKA